MQQPPLRTMPTPSPSHPSSSSGSSGRAARPAWLPLAAGSGIVVLLVALIAGLLFSQNGRRPTSANTTTPTATATADLTTPTPSGPQWTQIDSYTQIAGIALAPSDAHTAYQSLLETSKTSPTTLTLRRTRDAGVTWQAIALPSPLQGLSPDAFDGPPSVAVSPRIATTVFLTANARMPTCPNTASQAGVASQRLALPFSSGTPCYTQYSSTDGAQTWHSLTLPISGLLAGLRAQGPRLWAMISPPFVAQDMTAPAGHLAKSEDGGVTWTLADAALPSTVGIALYMPVPAGTGVFVVSDRADRFNSGVCQGCLPPPDFKLWRSDDAGAHWSQVSALAYQAVTSLLVAQRAGSTSPALYLQVLQGNSRDATLLSSGDGGRTWAPIPTAGVDPSTPQFQGAWGVLADGSVIAAYSQSQFSAHAFYAWKRGDAAWRLLAAPMPSPFLMALIVGAPASDSTQILTLLYQLSDGNRVATIRVS